MSYVIVFLGGGAGAALRHAVNLLAPRFVGSAFPWGTLAVNVAGSFFMGLLVGWFALRGALPEGWRLFALTGFLGGFTTFSAFSLDVANLVSRDGFTASFLYVTASVGLAIAALYAGLAAGRA